VVAVLALVLFWIWIFSGGPAKPNPDYLGDRAWVARAERTCRRTVDRIGQLPEASGIARATTRAGVLDQATEELIVMLGRLDEPPPDDAGDARLVEAWLADWRTYVADRRTYADELRRDPAARFLVAEKFDDPIDRVIGTFAEVNDMAACATPGDVG